MGFWLVESYIQLTGDSLLFTLPLTPSNIRQHSIAQRKYVFNTCSYCDLHTLYVQTHTHCLPIPTQTVSRAFDFRLDRGYEARNTCRHVQIAGCNLQASFSTDSLPLPLLTLRQDFYTTGFIGEKYDLPYSSKELMDRYAHLVAPLLTLLY